MCSTRLRRIHRRLASRACLFAFVTSLHSDANQASLASLALPEAPSHPHSGSPSVSQVSRCALSKVGPGLHAAARPSSAPSLLVPTHKLFVHAHDTPSKASASSGRLWPCKTQRSKKSDQADRHSKQRLHRQCDLVGVVAVHFVTSASSHASLDACTIVATSSRHGRTSWSRGNPPVPPSGRLLCNVLKIVPAHICSHSGPSLSSTLTLSNGELLFRSPLACSNGSLSLSRVPSHQHFFSWSTSFTVHSQARRLIASRELGVEYESL